MQVFGSFVHNSFFFKMNIDEGQNKLRYFIEISNLSYRK